MNLQHIVDKNTYIECTATIHEQKDDFNTQGRWWKIRNLYKWQSDYRQKWLQSIKVNSYSAINKEIVTGYIDKIIYNGEKQITNISLFDIRNRDYILVFTEQPILTNNGWKKISELDIFDEIARSFDNKIYYHKIKDITTISTPRDTFIIEMQVPRYNIVIDSEKIVNNSILCYNI